MPVGPSRLNVTDFSEYTKIGWQLCQIEKFKKGPNYALWNVNPIPADAVDGMDGAGILHSLSGTCALDLDDLQLAIPWLAEHGVDVESLLKAPDAVMIDSGRPGRAKLLYTLNRPMRTLKPQGSGCEFRSATTDGKSVQDVLPGSWHPLTKRQYEWKYAEPLIGHFSALPTIPASLLALWRSLVGQEIDNNGGEAPSAAPSAGLDELRRLIAKRNPDAEYDEWLRVGMIAHHETGGAIEGLQLWDEWSKRSKKYKGLSDLRVHWASFNSSPGKRVATVGSLRAEESADATDFEEVDERAEPDDTSTVKQLKAIAVQEKKDAIAELERTLVYVKTAEKYFNTDSHRLMMTESGIRHQFTPMMPRGKQGRLDPVNLLMNSSTKTIVDALAFHPGESALFERRGMRYANKFRCNFPKLIEPEQPDIERIEWLFGRIDDADFRDWLMMFYGHVVQKPGVKIKSAPLIWSRTQGNGKTTLMRDIPSLLVGREYSCEVNAALLNSDFNDYLLDAWHVNLSEFRAGTRGEREAISSKLKEWITEEVTPMHPKGQAAYTMENHFFVTASSNSDDAASVNDDDRRWAIHELNARPFTAAEQQWIHLEFLTQPRAAGVLWSYFSKIDISNFKPSAKAPRTKAHKDMVNASMTQDEEFLLTAYEEREGIFSRDVVRTQDVVDLLRKHVRFAPSVAKIGRVLCASPFHGHSIQFRSGDGRYRAIVLHNLDRWKNAHGNEIMAHIQGEELFDNKEFDIAN